MYDCVSNPQIGSRRDVNGGNSEVTSHGVRVGHQTGEAPVKTRPVVFRRAGVLSLALLLFLPQLGHDANSQTSSDGTGTQVSAAELERHIDGYKREIEGLNDTLVELNDALFEARSSLAVERKELGALNDSLIGARSGLAAEREKLGALNDTLIEAQSGLAAEREKLVRGPVRSWLLPIASRSSCRTRTAES